MILLKGSKMMDDFKEQCGRASSITKSEFAASKEAYEKQRDQLVSEVLLSVQAMTRLSSCLKVETAADEDHCNDVEIDYMTTKSETIQSWASFIEDQMSGLRLEKIHQTVIATINIGVSLYCGDGLEVF